MNYSVTCTRAEGFLASLPTNSIDLLFCSPPYEDARTYSRRDIARSPQAWVEWMTRIVQLAAPKVNGLMAFVIEGRTRNYRYSGTPLLLGADLIRLGFTLRKPPIFHRHGIAGSGGPDWLRNDYEIVLCVTRPGRLKNANPVACGKPPKYKPGGAMSNRKKDGGRVARKEYKPPRLSNPGNVLRFCVGGGRMGHDSAHQNEAPFPLGLAEFFVQTFSRPGQTVCDPFMGSGTTGHAALLHGRRFIGCDMRDSQVQVTIQRLKEIDK